MDQKQTEKYIVRAQDAHAYVANIKNLLISFNNAEMVINLFSKILIPFPEDNKAGKEEDIKDGKGTTDKKGS